MEIGDLVIVTFNDPVPGVDPIDGSSFNADRHRLDATRVVQDASTTVFTDIDGVIVAEWPTMTITSIVWPSAPPAAPSPSGKPKTGSPEWLADIKVKHPNAYASWTAEEDARLAQYFRRGTSISELARLHGRRRGAITARIKRLELDVPSTGPVPGAETPF